MNRTTFISSLMAFAVLASVLTFTGCDKPTPTQIAKGLEIGGEQGSYFGLREWAKKSPEKANETAERLQKSLNEVILPYLNGANLPSSDLVQEFVDSSLLDGLPEEVKTAIMAASLALDLYLPVPDAGTNLTPDQLMYMKAFLGGLEKGCGKFLSGKAPRDLPKGVKVSKDVKKNVWLTGEKKKK